MLKNFLVEVKGDKYPLVAINYETKEVTLKSKSGIKLVKGFDEVNFLAEFGVNDTKTNEPLFTGDFVVVDFNCIGGRVGKEQLFIEDSYGEPIVDDWDSFRMKEYLESGEIKSITLLSRDENTGSDELIGGLNESEKVEVFQVLEKLKEDELISTDNVSELPIDLLEEVVEILPLYRDIQKQGNFLAIAQYMDTERKHSKKKKGLSSINVRIGYDGEFYKKGQMNAREETLINQLHS